MAHDLAPDTERTGPRRRHEWWIPTGLIALALIPSGGGASRLASLVGGEATPESQRFFDAPGPVIVHVIGAVAFCVVGAFQFMPSLRRRHRTWHRRSGRVVMVTGMAAALSGLWMSVAYDLPDHDNWLLMVVRLIVGTVMAVGIMLAFIAIRRRDFRSHRAWMMRAYAIGQGAGTQAVVLGPMLLIGAEGPWFKAAGMTVAWLINIVVAEAIIRRPFRP